MSYNANKNPKAKLLFLVISLTVFGLACKKKSSPPPPPNTSELMGNWRTHSLIVNRADGWSWQGWMHGLLNIDKIGNASFSNIVTSPGGNPSNNTYKTTYSPERIIKAETDPTFYGYLGNDKQLIIATMTDGSGGYNITTAQKINPNIIYNPTDLEGKWQIHLLSDGNQDAPFTSWSGWQHGILNLNNSGRGEFNNMVASPGGNINNDSVFISIHTNGVLIDTSQNSFHGFMSADKKLIAATMTGDDGSFKLVIGQRIIPGTLYNSSNLAGTWQMHGIVAGSNTISEWSGWTHGKLTVNESGNGSFSDLKESSGISSSSKTATISISQSGIISALGDNSLHGFLDADKKTIFATSTDSRGGYGLFVLQKR